jgi:hypothetical protein
MSKIQQLLEDKYDQIDYDNLIEKYPWIMSKNTNCVISPDSDGLLCGLFMSHYLSWKVVGFYDGKVLLLKHDVSCDDVVFLDIEIFRENTKSMGHHILLYNKKKKPSNWDSNFRNCIQPNNIRNYDGYHDFRIKYPLASIHMLIGIIGSKVPMKLPESAICPLFFTDGTFNVLFKYPENVLNWLKFLKAGETASPLKGVFENQAYSVFSLMNAMNEFFGERDKISVPKERGDRLRISNSDGSPHNIVRNTDDVYKLHDNARERIIKFIALLSGLTTWDYEEKNWCWEELNLYRFTKGSFDSDGLRINNANFENFMSKNPLSWAMTSGQNIEYTLEEPDRLP